MTSATEELRRMLDEHDEYYKTSGNKTWWGRPIDRQTGKPINVFHYQAQPMGEDRLLVELQLATPKQAIAATLGDEGVGRSNDGVAELQAGTCELVNAADDLGDGTSSCMCDKCGYTAFDDWWYEFNYCPNCGRKVVDDG